MLFPVTYDALECPNPYYHFVNVPAAIARWFPAGLGAIDYLRAMKILMVCLGNICRSPLAEGILRKKAAAAGLDWQVDSAGTNGYHIGEAPHKLSQKVARLNGIDICEQRARQFERRDFANYDLIYALANDVMDDIRRIAGSDFDSNKAKLIMDELHPGSGMDVPDPWYGTEPGYHDVYRMIDEVCDAIIRNHSSFSPITKSIQHG